MRARSPLSALFAPICPLGVLVVTCSCTTPAHSPPRDAADIDARDEDAPAAATWLTRHARGTQVHDPVKNAPALTAPAFEKVRFPSGALSLLAVIGRPPMTATTSDTPIERLPGVLLIHDGAFLEDAFVDGARAFVDAGYVVMVPAFRGENGNPGAPERGFGEVDDALAAARFLASESDVDVDHLYAYGAPLVTDQLALADAPFRIIGAPLATKAHDVKVDDADERIARAFTPHASEAHRFSLFATAAAFLAAVKRDVAASSASE